MLTACELLAREPELHRVPIITDDGQLCNFITQVCECFAIKLSMNEIE